MTPKDLIYDLRSRISPAYADQIGTESYERRLCAETLEAQSDELERLREAAQLGAQWMRWWLDQCECDCDGGHTCGRPEREIELRSIEAALMRPNAKVSGRPHHEAEKR